MDIREGELHSVVVVCRHGAISGPTGARVQEKRTNADHIRDMDSAGVGQSMLIGSLPPLENGGFAAHEKDRKHRKKTDGEGERKA